MSRTLFGTIAFPAAAISDAQRTHPFVRMAEIRCEVTLINSLQQPLLAETSHSLGCVLKDWY